MDLPDSGIEPGSPVLQADSLPTELSGKPRVVRVARISGVEYWKRVKITEIEMEMGGRGGYSED